MNLFEPARPARKQPLPRRIDAAVKAGKGEFDLQSRVVARIGRTEVRIDTPQLERVPRGNGVVRGAAVHVDIHRCGRCQAGSGDGIGGFFPRDHPRGPEG